MAGAFCAAVASLLSGMEDTGEDTDSAGTETEGISAEFFSEEQPETDSRHTADNRPADTRRMSVFIQHLLLDGILANHIQYSTIFIICLLRRKTKTNENKRWKLYNSTEISDICNKKILPERLELAPKRKK